MQILKLTDETEVKILDGASIDKVTVVTDTFTNLGVIADALIKKDNWKIVQFLANGAVTGQYSDMKLNSPLFSSVNFDTLGNIIATISISEKSDLEKRLDALEDGQGLQDGAIADLGDAVSIIAEGGVL